MAFTGVDPLETVSRRILGTTSPSTNPNSDVVLCDPPIDSIQSLEWSPRPRSNILACASWDCTVRAYHVDGETGANRRLGGHRNDAPVLDLCWTADGGWIASAGCDKLIKLWNPKQPKSAPLIVGAHDEPVRKVVATAQPSAQLISGGWDRELRFWDPKQSTAQSANSKSRSRPKAVSAVKLEERVYAMDVRAPLLCVALANKKVVLFDLRNTAKPMSEMVTVLKHQLRCVALFPDRTGFAVGSVEGRCAIHNLTDIDAEFTARPPRADFAFKCHRRDQNVYAINALRFHNEHSTFASAGGDGSVFFWHKDRKQKLHSFAKMDLPVTDIDFNADGDLFAYAVSYDWSKGIEHFEPKLQKPEIFIHKFVENELRPHSPNYRV